jgi:hypothetical protein
MTNLTDRKTKLTFLAARSIALVKILMRDVRFRASYWPNQKGVTMRTTLAIDDDVLAVAKHLAEHQKKTVGEVISSLVRQSLTRADRSSKRERNGIPLLVAQKDTTPVTMELVNRLRDELP